MLQIEERIHFDSEDRRRLLVKSNGVCAKCGKPLSVEKFETSVEHIIPISKGGTNKDNNLIILCPHCNEKKDNLIVNPDDFYRYAIPEVKDEINEMYTKYFNRVTWLGLTRFTREDIMCLDYFTPLPSLDSHQKKGGYYSKNAAKVCKQTVILRRVDYNDLPMVIDFVKRYHEKFHIPFDDNSIVEDFYLSGCMYIAYRKSDPKTILCLLPIHVSIMNRKGEKYYILNVNGILTRYQKPELLYMYVRCIQEIVSQVGSIAPYGQVSVGYNVINEDSYAKLILQYGCQFTDEDMYIEEDSDGIKWCNCFAIMYGDKPYREGALQTEEYKMFSNFLQDELRLEPITQDTCCIKTTGYASNDYLLSEHERKRRKADDKEKKNKKMNQMAKERKRLNQIDEYDMAYYM